MSDDATSAKGVHHKGEFLNLCGICKSYVERDEFGDHVLGHEVQEST